VSIERPGNVFVTPKELLRVNEIPSIAVYGETLPAAWEIAVLATWEFGSGIPTEYDQDIDPESRDGSMMITVLNPLKEPRIHRSMPVGLDELRIYVEEVVNGARDYKIGSNDHGWSYTYHERLDHWPGVNGWRKLEGMTIELPHVDQLNIMIDKLSRVPHSRRAQAITWMPLVDADHSEPPCLQRVWGRVIKSTDGIYYFEMNTHWRSRDALKAAFMNMYAMIELQKKMAGEISRRSGFDVRVGRYVDVSDSFHLYGSYIRKGEMAGFLRNIDARSFSDRTYRSDDPLVQELFKEGLERLERELVELKKK